MEHRVLFTHLSSCVSPSGWLLIYFRVTTCTTFLIQREMNYFKTSSLFFLMNSNFNYLFRPVPETAWKYRRGKYRNTGGGNTGGGNTGGGNTGGGNTGGGNTGGGNTGGGNTEIPEGKMSTGTNTFLCNTEYSGNSSDINVRVFKILQHSFASEMFVINQVLLVNCLANLVSMCFPRIRDRCLCVCACACVCACLCQCVHVSVCTCLCALACVNPAVWLLTINGYSASKYHIVFTQSSLIQQQVNNSKKNSWNSCNKCFGCSGIHPRIIVSWDVRRFQISRGDKYKTWTIHY